MNIIETRLVSVDGSTQKTALTLFVDGGYKKHALLDFSKDKNIVSRFESMSKGIWNILNEFKPNIIYIEETYSAKNAQTTKILTRLQGVVYAWCLNNNCDFNTITPASWRKQLLFKQGKSVKREQLKQQSIDYILKKFNLDVTDDEADSICIGDAVIKMFSKEK